MCVLRVRERKRDIASSHMQPFSLSHPHCCHTPIPMVNQPPWQLRLRRWHKGQDWSYLLSCMMGGVFIRVGMGVSDSGLSVCFLSPHLRAVCLSPLSVHPSLFLFISSPLPSLPLLESRGRCGAERCWVLFSCCCQLSPRPLQDKPVIAPGTAGLSSSSSKQICCNFICNWALNWEQIEAAL